MLEENNIYLGDCLELMKQIPDKSIDCVITDPPYIIKSGGGSSFINTNKHNNGSMDWFVDGFNVSLIFNEFKRIIKKFNLFCFCSNDQLIEIMSYGKNNNFYTTCLVWHKLNSAPFANNVWRQDIEFIVHIREKGATFQGNAIQKKKVIEHNQLISGLHPTEKPLQIIERLIEISSNENDLILDPFLGSGTTAIACYDLKRRYIGIEKEPKYFGIAKNRIDQFKAQGRLF